MTKKSLSEMLADTAPAPLPKASAVVTLVTGQHIVDELEQIERDYSDLLSSPMPGAKDESGEATGPPLKAGQSNRRMAQARELQERSQDALRRLADHQVTIGLTGISGGQWQRWKDEHPPRQGVASDVAVTHGWCNAADLLDDLARYVTSWDGEPLKPGAWDQLAEQVVYADRRDLVTKVVEMFENGVTRSPFSQSGSSTTENSATG